MFIDKVSLKDWSRFKEFNATLGPLTMIVGPNGSGKSSFVAAIAYALTGATGEYKLDQRIRQNCDDEDAAYVYVKFKHKGQVAHVSRYMSGSQRPVMSCQDNGKPHEFISSEFRGAKEIKQELNRLLDIDPQILNEYIFVPQWDMFAFLTQSSDARAKTFAKLFGVSRAEQLWKALGEVELPDPGPVPDLAEAVNALAAAEKAYETARTEEAAAKAKLEDLKAKRGTVSLEQYRRARYLNTQMTHDKNALVIMKTRLADTEDAYRRLEDKKKELEQQIAKLAPFELEAKMDKERWAGYNKFHDNLNSAQLLVNETRRALRDFDLANPLPLTPSTYVEPGEPRELMTHRLSSCNAEICRLEAFICSLREDCGEVACPTCGTTTTNPAFADRVQLSRLDLITEKARANELYEKITTSDGHDDAVDWLNSQRCVIRRDLEDTEDRLQEFLSSSITKPEYSITEADVILDSLKLLRDSWYEINTNSALNAHRIAQSEHDRMHDRILVYQKELEQTGVPVLAEEEIAKLFELDSLAHTAENTLGCAGWAVTRTLHVTASAKTKVEQAQKANDEAANVQRVKKEITQLRDLFHRENLPAKVSQHYLDAVKDGVKYDNGEERVPGVNTLLELFDAPFRLARTEELSPIVRFADGREGPAELMLSGGQKVVFALAFRTVVSLLFSGDLGLLCLDEPTVGLDEKNIQCVELALNKLKEFGAARGLQFILITHENSLSHICDTIIDLSNVH